MIHLCLTIKATVQAVILFD